MADSVAKEAAKEMIDNQEEFYEGEADKKAITRSMKGSFIDKWQRMYKNSEHTEQLQERTSDGSDGNHSVSLPIILLKIKVNQMLSSSYISSLLVSIL